MQKVSGDVRKYMAIIFVWITYFLIRTSEL